jgi:hypothetical protein
MDYGLDRDFLSNSNNFNYPDLTNVYPKKEKNIEKEFFPDFEIDFSEKFDVVNDSINLALLNLNLSMNEYNSLDIESLKSMRRIDNHSLETYAINILIYYKKSKQNKLGFAVLKR